MFLKDSAMESATCFWNMVSCVKIFCWGGKKVDALKSVCDGERQFFSKLRRDISLLCKNIDVPPNY